MSSRSRPFGEWVIVYFDGEKTNTETILKRLKTNRCPEAKQVMPAVVKKGEVEVLVSCPLATAGDFFEVGITLPKGKKGKLSAQAPKGWTFPDGAERDLPEGRARCDIQTPKGIKTGKEELVFRIQSNGGQAEEIKIPVEIITRQLR
jgi:hypothetical protein